MIFSRTSVAHVIGVTFRRRKTRGLKIFEWRVGARINEVDDVKVSYIGHRPSPVPARIAQVATRSSRLQDGVEFVSRRGSALDFLLDDCKRDYFPHQRIKPGQNGQTAESRRFHRTNNQIFVLVSLVAYCAY